jgi:very-short-patch-repair endonuclease
MNVASEHHPARSTRVLVAVMNNQRDFDIARHEGWYRIPYERAPARVGADYLAFYQTKAFDREQWAVNYYAPIRRYRLVARRDLFPKESDHPRAEAPYYKIEIAPLQHLPRPIPSRRLRRITFIPTTLDRLLQAEEINDLWCGSPAEERVWRMFKNNGISAERRYRLREDEEAYVVDFALLCRHGKVAVCLEGAGLVENVSIVRERSSMDDYELAAQGWTVLRLNERGLAGAQPTCLAGVVEAMERLGGELPAGCDLGA